MTALTPVAPADPSPTQTTDSYAEWMLCLVRAAEAAEFAREEEARRLRTAELQKHLDKGRELRKALITLGFDPGELHSNIYTAPDGVMFEAVFPSRTFSVSVEPAIAVRVLPQNFEEMSHAWCKVDLGWHAGYKLVDAQDKLAGLIADARSQLASADYRARMAQES